MKTFSAFLFGVGFIITIASLVKGAYLIHPCLGGLTLGVILMFIGYSIYNEYKKQ